MRHRRFILFGLALLMFAAPVFADGELGAGQKIVVRYFAGGKLAKSVTVTPDGDAVWTVKDASILSKIDTARAFVVSGSNETPIGGGGGAAGPGARVSAQTFRIGPEDVLDINVWDNEQLSKTVPVRPDGMISLPLLGDVPAAGKTALQLKQELGSRLSRYVDKPEVTVTLSAINSYKVFVQGHVTNTGAYPITGTSTITQAISLAGGFTQFADENGIVILRGSGSGTEKIRVKYKRIIAGKDPDVAVLPGDTIVVP